MPSLTQPFVNDTEEIFAHANIREKLKPCLKIQIFSIRFADGLESWGKTFEKVGTQIS